MAAPRLPQLAPTMSLSMPTFPALQRTPSQVRHADHLVAQLDDLGERVRILRTDCARLEDEAQSIQNLLQRFTHTDELTYCDAVDREELEAQASYIRSVLSTVTVRVEKAVRRPEQRDSLAGVNDMIERVTKQLDVCEARGEAPPLERVRAMLNSALPEAVGPVDDRFQSRLLGCSLDDQKDIRTRLEALLQRAQDVAAAQDALSPEQLAAQRAAYDAAHPAAAAQPDASPASFTPPDATDSAPAAGSTRSAPASARRVVRVTDADEEEEGSSSGHDEDEGDAHAFQRGAGGGGMEAEQHDNATPVDEYMASFAPFLNAAHPYAAYAQPALPARARAAAAHPPPPRAPTAEAAAAHAARRGHRGGHRKHQQQQAAALAAAAEAAAEARGNAARAAAGPRAARRAAARAAAAAAAPEELPWAFGAGAQAGAPTIARRAPAPQPQRSPYVDMYGDGAYEEDRDMVGGGGEEGGFPFGFGALYPAYAAPPRRAVAVRAPPAPAPTAYFRPAVRDPYSAAPSLFPFYY
ncbi:hypothetical protein EON68_00305 [archaeon]|nr:MAG: hypothetical protein EON68_00305 [archaeon]